ncbi:hypothetical protein BpHYR1_003290 [Brachionus plicatilis]|uniref:Uncharacterized protein n=1 Tax=Brachionus plicatilis TaxID=10195 RepID=A0A3M7PKZ5_BRAPC|nr:hypothetical protein BpHYR1_003290 [Brachionus plicatilis]
MIWAEKKTYSLYQISLQNIIASNVLSFWPSILRLFQFCKKYSLKSDSFNRELTVAIPLTNVKELRSLLGAIQSNGRFIRDTCSTTEALWRLTKKNAKCSMACEDNSASTQLLQQSANEICETDDGVLLKGSHIIIPSSLRKSLPK